LTETDNYVINVKILFDFKINSNMWSLAMVKKPQTQKVQLDTEDELLNFELEELFGKEAPAEDEVIELVELIEVDKDEDRTKELAVKSQVKEKPAAKAVPIDEAKASLSGKALPEDEEETDLDLSDLTLDMDVETTRPVQSGGEGEITEADLEDLLQETSDEEISFDLSSGEEGVQGGKDEEVTDADLEALLQEATAEEIEEVEEEGEVLEVIAETEAVEEVQLEEEKPSLTDLEAAGDSFEETQEVAEPVTEEEAPPPTQAGAEEPMILDEPVREEIASEEPFAEKLTGISEERLEEIITKVVQEVVERVARETMRSVAERVIGQAIEALKMSLESSSEES
jgi:S-DNA-T family DNA segregation ATPase FtsK/SpoIIIE